MTAAPQTSHKTHPKFISLSIFWQVLGMGICIIILGFVINTLIVLKAPEPPPSGYTLTQAAQALKSGTVRLSNGHTLKTTVSETPPPYVTTQSTNSLHQSFQYFIASRLATALNVPANTVWVSIERPSFRDRARDRDRDRDFGPSRGLNDGLNEGPGGPFERVQRPNDAPNAPGSGAGSSSLSAAGDALPSLPPPPSEISPFGKPRAGPQGFEGQNAHARFFNGAESPSDIIFPAFNAAWKQKDGTYRLINAPRDLIQPWQIKLLWGFGLTTLAIVPLVYVLSRRLTGPIIAFSEAAAKIGVEDNAPPILAFGPREVRAAADVLNAMQSRIKKQVESRTALMAAIAHDLKTPLARMRLRIEDLPSPLRDKLGNDISHMDDLIRSAMSFAGAHKMSENLRPLDLSALTEALCEDLSPLCELETSLIEENIRIKGDAVALKRILTNLIENAGHYAGRCQVELSYRGRNAELRIIDTGPGLPDDALEAVFEPFYRMESSRNRDTGGTGLGLSVARALAEAQGGSLILKNRYAGTKIVGLEALLTLPML